MCEFQNFSSHLSSECAGGFAMLSRNPGFMKLSRLVFTLQLTIVQGRQSHVGDFGEKNEMLACIQIK